MRLAVTYDFSYNINISREGIGVFAKLLISALMDYDKELEIEFWTYDFNVDNVKLVFSDIFAKYPNRIFIYSNDSKLSKEQILSKRKFLSFYYFKKHCYNLKKKFFRNKKYDEKILKLKQKREEFFAKQQYELKYKISEYSKADAVFMMFVSLKLGHEFPCPKFIQVHDLFTIYLFDLFVKHWGFSKVKINNDNILQNLKQYAESNTIFVSSSEFTAKEHSLRFIPSIKQEQVAVIPFPPLVKSFNTQKILSKDDFKNKYGIKEIYIAIPSQNRPNKNWATIFRAIHKLKEKGINIQFVTTGTVSDIKDDADLVKVLGIEDNILELGEIPERDLYMLYKYEDIAIGSTIIEGMGISGQVIEALMIGNIPAIHSRCYGYKESLKAVGLNEETADLNWFDFDDYKTLADKIENVLKNPQEHIDKQKHIATAYTCLTWSDVAKKYLELFKGVKDKQEFYIEAEHV